jgi:methylthioribose-1-phosphate isomerase
MTLPRLRPVELSADGSSVRIIDQRRLPSEFIERDLRTLDDVVDAITSLAVRGAPAIGICAAAGLAAVTYPHRRATRSNFTTELMHAADTLRSTRPTAFNLAWAINRCVHRVERTAGDVSDLWNGLRSEADRILEEDLAMSAAIGAYGLALLPQDTLRVLTHCNTGALATGGGGTALGVVYAAHAAGRTVRVFATETRPLFQGARLTTWELQRAGIPVTALIDSAAAVLLRDAKLDAVLVGADRIAANGDVANKVGTYALALAAAQHGVPFFVCAPHSTIDPSASDGQSIPIEMRSRDELAGCGGLRVLPDEVDVWTPAFDVTPAALVSGIVTDAGVFHAPYNFLIGAH